MITHFVVVFCVGNSASNTLTNYDNIFWDLEKFSMITHFVAVFFVGNNASNTSTNFIYTGQHQLVKISKNSCAMIASEASCFENFFSLFTYYLITCDPS